MRLERTAVRPYRVVGGRELARAGNLALRVDRVGWPDGRESEYRLLNSPDSAFMVPVHEDGTTVLVRQWRHAWDGPAWEVPAGTLESGENPLAGARRELVEEAGLSAEEWTPLGVTRATALLTGRQHLFLARGLTRVSRAPEPYEADMILQELPLAEAALAALGGEIEHAASATALLRAARLLGLLQIQL